MRRHSLIKQAGNRADSILRLSLESPVIIPILANILNIEVASVGLYFVSNRNCLPDDAYRQAGKYLNGPSWPN